jgi:hypothetical protein
LALTCGEQTILGYGDRDLDCVEELHFLRRLISIFKNDPRGIERRQHGVVAVHCVRKPCGDIAVDRNRDTLIAETVALENLSGVADASISRAQEQLRET